VRIGTSGALDPAIRDVRGASFWDVRSGTVCAAQTSVVAGRLDAGPSWESALGCRGEGLPERTPCCTGLSVFIGSVPVWPLRCDVDRGVTRTALLTSRSAATLVSGL